MIGLLACSGKTDLRSRSFAVLVLLVLVALIALGPFVLMMAAPRSELMAGLMRSMMSSGAHSPTCLSAPGRLGRLALAVTGPFSLWRLAAAIGIVAVATVGDLYWHQTHPMEVRASMAALPPHQAILAGFVTERETPVTQPANNCSPRARPVAPSRWPDTACCPLLCVQ